MTSDSFATYGQDQLQILTQHFGDNYLDPAALQEWIT